MNNHRSRLPCLKVTFNSELIEKNILRYGWNVSSPIFWVDIHVIWMLIKSFVELLLDICLINYATNTHIIKVKRHLNRFFLHNTWYGMNNQRSFWLFSGFGIVESLISFIYVERLYKKLVSLKDEGLIEQWLTIHSTLTFVVVCTWWPTMSKGLTCTTPLSTSLLVFSMEVRS